MSFNEENNLNSEKYSCSIEHYIEGDYSICREERQYAVFLYNILCKYQNPENRTGDISELFTVCGVPKEAIIKHVFYEASLMRDFFERNRRIVLGKKEDVLLNKSFSPSMLKVEGEKSFNKKLIQYIEELSDTKDICKQEPLVTETDCSRLYEEVNLGHNNVELSAFGVSGTEQEQIKTYAAYMMNVKPDIAVVYEKKGKKYLLFLECKFESGESTYKNGMKQREIQWHVADFLCKFYLSEEKISVADEMKDKKSRLVRFVRKESDNPENAISITKLIELNNRIFSPDF